MYKLPHVVRKYKWIVFISVILFIIMLYRMSYAIGENEAKKHADEIMKYLTDQKTGEDNYDRYWDRKTIERLKKSFEQGELRAIDSFVEKNSDFVMTEEEQERFQELLIRSASKARYSIGEVVRTKKSCEVSVTIEPVLALSGVLEGLSDSTISYISKKGMDEFDDYEYMHDMLEKQFENIEKRIDTPKFGEPIVKKLRIQADDEYKLALSNDVAKIGQAMISGQIDKVVVSPDHVMKRTESLIRTAITGEADSNLEPMDIIEAAKYANEVQHLLDRATKDTSSELIKYLDEEGRQTYRSLCQKIIESIKYEVVEVKETQGGYDVKVRKSLPDVEALYKRALEVTTTYAKSQDFSSISKDIDYYKIVYDEEMNQLIAGMDQLIYKEPITYDLKYIKKGDNYYDVDVDSFRKLMSSETIDNNGNYGVIEYKPAMFENTLAEKEKNASILNNYAAKFSYLYGESYKYTCDRYGGGSFSEMPAARSLGYSIMDFDDDGDNELLVISLNSNNGCLLEMYELEDGEVTLSDSIYAENDSRKVLLPHAASADSDISGSLNGCVHDCDHRIFLQYTNKLWYMGGNEIFIATVKYSDNKFTGYEAFYDAGSSPLLEDMEERLKNLGVSKLEIGSVFWEHKPIVDYFDSDAHEIFHAEQHTIDSGEDGENVVSQTVFKTMEELRDDHH